MYKQNFDRKLQTKPGVRVSLKRKTPQPCLIPDIFDYMLLEILLCEISREGFYSMTWFGC